MALGTPFVTGSSSNPSTVTPFYPATVSSSDVIFIIVWEKPTTANTGGVATPSGFTLVGSIIGAGGYGSTTGADVGNTNLYIFRQNTVTGSEGGSFVTVTATGASIFVADMLVVPSGGGTISVGFASGSDTTAGSVSAAMDVDPGFVSGDVAVWAMCIPTDVTTPNQFSAHNITASGATFGTKTELNEVDSAGGNDIGGYIAWAPVTAGPSSGVATITATAGGTTTNVRGPLVLLRVREGTSTPSVTVNNAAHAHTATSPSISAQSSVTPNSASHAHAATSPTLTAHDPAVSVSPDNAAHDHTATSPSLAAKSSAVPADATHGHTASSPSLAAKSTVAPDSASHAHAATEPSLAAKASASPASATHSHVATSPSLALGTIAVAPTDALHGHQVTQPALVFVPLVMPNPATHAHTASSPLLGVGGSVAVEPGEHAHFATSPTLAAKGSVSINSAALAHTASSPSIAARFTAAPDSASHQHSATSPTIAARSTVAVNDNTLGHTATSPAIASIPRLVVDNAAHAHSASSPGITARSAVLPDDALHVSFSTSPALIARTDKPLPFTGTARNGTSPRPRNAATAVTTRNAASVRMPR